MVSRLSLLGPIGLAFAGYCFPELAFPPALPAVSLIKALLKAGLHGNPSPVGDLRLLDRRRAYVLRHRCVLDAELDVPATAALVPPVVLLCLWHDNPGQTIAEVMREGRS